MGEFDKFDHFHYRCSTKSGSGALFRSHHEQNSVRVFCSSDLPNTNKWRTQAITYENEKGVSATRNSYRYYGLYKVFSMKDEVGDTITDFPRSDVIFRLKCEAPKIYGKDFFTGFNELRNIVF